MVGELVTLVAATGADVVALQEANDYADVLAKPGAVPGYVYVGFHDAKEQDGDPLLVRDGLQVTDARPVKMTTAGWVTVRGGHTPPIWSTVATVAGVQVWSVHTPPSQQPTIKRTLMPARRKAYDELMGNLAPAAVSVVAGDWNVTPGGAGAGTFPKPRFRALGLTLVAPDAGTHGSRVIDYLGAKGCTVTDVEVVALEAGSDHKPVVATVTA